MPSWPALPPPAAATTWTRNSTSPNCWSTCRHSASATCPAGYPTAGKPRRKHGTPPRQIRIPNLDRPVVHVALTISLPHSRIAQLASFKMATPLEYLVRVHPTGPWNLGNTRTRFHRPTAQSAASPKPTAAFCRYEAVAGLLLLRPVMPLSRRDVVYFNSGAHIRIGVLNKNPKAYL